LRPGKIELFSTVLPAIGEPPLPEFRAPFAEVPGFPLTLAPAKTPLYCHGQHRNLARLRRLEPDPVAELRPGTAAARGIGGVTGWRSRGRTAECGRRRS
jgi:anaerobic selenocysteine-containing dehydrogenase